MLIKSNPQFMFCNRSQQCIYNYIIMQDGPDFICNYSIMNINTKIEEFLVYYLHFLFQTKIKIKFRYDSRNKSLCIQGDANNIKQSYQLMKDMISKYKAAQFSVGFSAASLLNFFVGGIADRPNIKYFDSKKVQELNKFPNIKIQTTKNKTYMIGPKKQVDKLLEDIAVWFAGSLVGAVVKQKNIQKQIKQGIKQVKSQKIQYIKNIKEGQSLPQPPQFTQKRCSQKASDKQIQQKLQIKKSPSQPAIIKPQIPSKNQQKDSIILNSESMKKKYQQDRPAHIINVQNPNNNQQASNSKSLSQQKSNQNPTDKIPVSFKFPLDDNLKSSKLACIYIQNKITQILKFQLPQFIFIQFQINQNQIIFSGFVLDLYVKKIGENIMDKFIQDYVSQKIQIDISSSSFFVQLKKTYQFKLFPSIDRRSVVHIYQLSIGKQKIDILKSMVNNMIKKYSAPVNQQNNNQSSSIIQPILPVNISQAQLKPFKDEKPKIEPPLNSLPPQIIQNVDNKKISKRHFRFPFYIGQYIWNFAEQISQKFDQININFHPQSKFYGSLSHIRIFEDSSFSAKGPEKQLKQFSNAIQEKILALKKQKYVFNIQITQQMYKKMTHQYEKVKKIQTEYKVKIITNPQIIANYQAKQILTTKQKKKLQIIGIKGSLCDLFIDNFGTILIFERQRDLQKYKNNLSNLRNIIDDKVFSTMVVCESKGIKLSCLIEQTILQYIKQIQPKKVKVFIFAEFMALKQLIWDLIQILDSIKVDNLQYFLVFQQGCEQQTKNIPDRYKRWFTIINDTQTFYSQAGNTAINKAMQNNQNEIVLNSDHIIFNKPTHTAYIDRHMFSHYKYKFGLDIKYRDCQDWIQFDYQGKTYKLGDCRFRQIRQAQKNKQKQMQLSISLFKINIPKMKQTNIWNNYERDIKYKELSLIKNNLMITNEPVKYITQIIGTSKDQIQSAIVAINKQFSRKCKQVLKFNSSIKQVQIQKLYKLCSSNNIQISKLSNSQYEIAYELGHPNIDVIQKYAEMIKCDDISVIYPPTWKHDSNKEIYAQIQIDPQAQQFTNIAKAFPFKILKLKRIQNYLAYSRYFNQKKFLQKLNGGKSIKQMLLYHGTRTMDPSLITADKQITFNINYSADRNYMGRATYFAQKPQYSHTYRFKMNINTGVMLLCAVQVGDSQKCPKLQVNYLDTDFKDASKTVRYESMTQFYDGSQIYTVYKNNRAYPMYRIQYKV